MMGRLLHFLLLLLIVCFCGHGFADGQTRVKIEGMRNKSEMEVMRLMGDRLEYVEGKEASASRADDAAFLVRQVLRDDGYSEVAVDSRVMGRNEILLTVREGRRFYLGDVNFTEDGNQKRLAGLFALPAEKGRPLGVGDPPFREDDVATGLGFLVQEMQADGYWEATAELKGREVVDSGRVNVEIDVRQGRRFKIGRAQVTSVDGRGVVRVATTVEPYVGRWASTGELNSLRLELAEAFTSRGYPDAEVRVSRALSNGVYTPVVWIDLGVRMRLREVKVAGHEKTNPRRLERVVKKMEGDWYDEAAMNRQVRKFLASSAFSSIVVETEEVAPKRIDATLRVQEAKAKEVTLAAGMGSFEGPIFRAGYTDRNFMGELLGFSAGMELSGRGALGEVKLTDPWWLGTEVALSLRLYSLIYQFDGYNSFESGVEAKWTWKPGDHYSLDVVLGYSLVNVSGKGLADTFLGEKTYGHPRLGIIQIWDYRDSPVLPKSGWHVAVPLQIGAAVSNDSSGYVKAGVNGGWYGTMGRWYEIGLGGFANVVVPTGEILDLPIDLRVFNGGARSVRSFPERGLGPKAGGDPYGGYFSWAANAELRRTIIGSLKGVSFVDVGNISGDYSGLVVGDVEVAMGLGLRIDLPIGPVRLEYGHNMTRDPGEPSGTWHFAIGTTF